MTSIQYRIRQTNNQDDIEIIEYEIEIVEVRILPNCEWHHSVESGCN